MPILPINTLPTSIAGGGPNVVTSGLSALGLLPPQWGIFNQAGRSVISFDTVKNFDYRRDWNISDYPLERGAFESYNKVQTPFVARIGLSTGGSFAARQAFLQSIQAIEDDLNLYDVVTPEVTYQSVNISHVDYHRADGLYGIITVNIFLTEIRVTTQAELSTQAPSGATGTHVGQVQTDAPTAAQTGQAAGGGVISAPAGPLGGGGV